MYDQTSFFATNFCDERHKNMSSAFGSAIARGPGSPGSPASPSVRRGNGVLLNEPSSGLDTVYEGAHQMKSTEYMFGPKGGRWSTSQAYGASFRSVTPRPWQRLPTRQESMAPRLGPGEYDPMGESHGMAASISWSSRGRCARSQPRPLRLFFSLSIDRLIPTHSPSLFEYAFSSRSAERGRWERLSTALVGPRPSSPLWVASTSQPRRSEGLSAGRTASC